MATIQQRPFSKNYSGLINQSVIAGVVIVICVTFYETAKRKRRGRHLGDELGSVESWHFGYLYQGRSWAKRPSPPSPRGWPLSWVRQVIAFPEDRFNELRGVDATLYVRFLLSCFWFALVHTFTTLPILLPIHITFSIGAIPPASMVRASISSLVNTTEGLSLLWIHLLLLIWVTLTWMSTLYWICRGAFSLRGKNILTAPGLAASGPQEEKQLQYFPHLHPQHLFHSSPPLDNDQSNRGLRLRTVMVTNIPPLLRSEKDLKEYFEYYMSRPVARHAIELTTTTQPGFIIKSLAFLFNQSRLIPFYLREKHVTSGNRDLTTSEGVFQSSQPKSQDVPTIDRVVVVRRMTEVASLLERREEVLRLLETAHIKLATKALFAVKEAMYRFSKPHTGPLHAAIAKLPLRNSTPKPTTAALKAESTAGIDGAEGEDRMELLIHTLGRHVSWPSMPQTTPPLLPVSAADSRSQCVWEALLSLPRSTLDVYQPLIHLSTLFRGKTVPSIDYYTAKLDVLTSLITEKRASAIGDYEAMSTAFVTFADPAHARRACKHLAVHPANPLQCLVTMAPSYEDLDWIRLMRPTFKVEFVKDWVVDLGVWGFIIFWIFPVSIFVGLVSIQNISVFWPGLATYLDKHEWGAELLQSFIPTIMVALLALLIPLLLLLIAKKAHTIATLSSLHDRVMTRYYKFLVVNVFVFFCVGTAALQSFLVSLSANSGLEVNQIADSFPTAGPFYVGWLIFTMAMHGGLELALFGLPLVTYLSTQRQVTPRKRAQGIRPRTFNYYYWLPNHVLVVHVLLVFAVLNPLVLPFGLVYFGVEAIIVKNQLLHVYAKTYEGNGRLILIRVVRYSLDGLLLAQTVFLAYMVVLKKTANVAVSAVLIVMTAFFKLSLTRICRAKYERADVLEAETTCGTELATPEVLPTEESANGCPSQNVETRPNRANHVATTTAARWTWRLPVGLNFAYATIPTRPQRAAKRRPNPFRSTYFNPCEDQSKPSSPTAESSPLSRVLDKAEEVIIQPKQRKDSEGLQKFAPVTRHPPHPAWDDEPSLDHPYDNPFYMRPVEDVLWLPRDPLRPLNLDDTIDMRVSLTSQPASGALGTWRQDELIASGISLSMSIRSGFSCLLDDDELSFSSSTIERIGLDGSEEIDLPSSIASRIKSPRRDDDVETTATLRPQSLHLDRRMPSNGSGSRSPILGLDIRRPSAFRVEQPSTFRSFSVGDEAIVTPFSNSLPPSLECNPRDRSVTMGYELGIQRGQRLRRPANPSPSAQHAFESAMPELGGRGQHISNVISTREAVVGEVIMEEVAEARSRLRGEVAESEWAQEPGSWMTRWMFAKEP
ncbi:DUF221-domain-containing protein [Sparassis crispa]|uniref:DUF221-domain-containing protein n=1 Tax=Sparassis crispa TaxID=139825 RepID=A0A401GSA1_9APHY|nr:DUF221-domain-containing protein [Sparassis crispa]GBE85039.1 DUF221-domain-containing protein [Sparassis crispa]